MTDYLAGDHYYGATKLKRGFNTIDYSKFLSQSEVECLEKTGLYLTANGLKSNLDLNEIENIFPVNYAFYRLPPPSNRYVYLRSCYTGTVNHTPARYGNYFSHSIVLKKLLPSFPACIFFNQVDFKKTFTIQEEEAYFSALSERNIELDFDDNTLKEAFFRFNDFLLQNNHLDIFSRTIDLIVHGIFIYRETNITICANKDILSDLIFSVNFFLPQHLANKISFATYVNSPVKYPFQITGIIPECGITSFDSKNYVLINHNNDFKYNPKYSYTLYLISLIKDNTEHSYLDWKSLNEDAVIFDISSLDNSLNIPVDYINFRKNIENENAINLSKLFNSNLPKIKEEDLIYELLNKRPDLYYDYILGELKNKRMVLHSEKEGVFNSFYLKYFCFNSFRQNYFSSFIDEFTKQLEEKELPFLMNKILLNSDCTDLLPVNWLIEKMKTAQVWYTYEFVDIEKKIELANSISIKYILSDNIRISIPHIMRYDNISNLIEQVNQSNLTQIVRDYHDDLLGLSLRERVKVLISCFNKTFVKGEFNFDYKIHIDIVSEFLPENQDDFWGNFFDENSKYNAEKIFQLIPLSYLKRNFVAYHFMKHSMNLICLRKLRLNEELISWVEDYLLSNALDYIIIENFKNEINKLYKKNSWLRF